MLQGQEKSWNGHWIGNVEVIFFDKNSFVEWREGKPAWSVFKRQQESVATKRNREMGLERGEGCGGKSVLFITCFFVLDGGNYSMFAY